MEMRSTIKKRAVFILAAVLVFCLAVCLVPKRADAATGVNVKGVDIRITAPVYGKASSASASLNVGASAKKALSLEKVYWYKVPKSKLSGKKVNFQTISEAGPEEMKTGEVFQRNYYYIAVTAYAVVDPDTIASNVTTQVNGSTASVYTEREVKTSATIVYVARWYAPLRDNLKYAKVTAPKMVFNGLVKKPKITVTYQGRTLKEGVDYTVSYSNNVNIGTAKFVVKGKGYAYNSKSGSFEIVPGATKLISAAGGKNRVTLKWAKYKRASGYQIQASPYKNFKTIYVTEEKSVSKTSGAYSGMPRGKTNYFRVRTYTVVKGKKYYSTKWSNVKSAYIR